MRPNRIVAADRDPRERGLRPLKSYRSLKENSHPAENDAILVS